MLRFLFLALFVATSVSQADEPSFADKQIYPVLKKSTDLHAGITFLTGTLMTLAARTQDDYTRGEWRKSSKISESDAHIGDLIGTGAGSVLVIGGQYLWDPNESNYQSHIRGFVYGGLSIYALKTAFGRNRPGNSNSHQSFPSGHTAISFMTATHLMYAYGWQAAAIAYPIATFVGISRMHDDAHWLSDTVAGAFLGYFVGRATYYDSSAYSANSQSSAASSIQYQWIPIVQHDETGVSLHVSY